MNKNTKKQKFSVASTACLFVLLTHSETQWNAWSAAKCVSSL